MSYRNPKQVVDTQSGQYVRDMMKSVTGTAVNAIKEQQKRLRENQEKNIAFQRKTIQAQAKIANSANAANIENSGTDWATAIRQGLEEYGELYTKSLKDPLRFSSEDALRMSSLANMGTQIRSQAVEDQADMDTFQAGFEAGPGQYGGFGMFVDPAILKRLAIQGKMGATPGSSIGSFDTDSAGNFITKVTSYNENGEVVGTNANRGNMADFIVPNPTKNMQSIKAAIKQRNDDYFKDQKIQSNFDKDTQTTTKSQFQNREALIKEIRALSDGYIEGLGANSSIRLRNNKMRGYIKDENARDIIDPNKAQWDTNKEGKVIDPQLEQTKQLYAEMLADEMGLGKDEKIVAKIKAKTKTVTEPKAFQEAIKQGFAIKTSKGEVWKAEGERGTKNYQYVLPGVVNSKGQKNVNFPEQRVNYYLIGSDGEILLDKSGNPKINSIGINSSLGIK
jgi:hypothetical protein